MIDAKLAQLAQENFASCSFSATEAKAFYARPPGQLGLNIDIVSSTTGVGHQPPRIDVRGDADAFRRLAVALILAALGPESVELLWSVRPGHYLALMRWPYQRGERCGDFLVSAVDYRFVPEREDDTPESVFLDHWNPFFGFIEGGQFHAHLESPPPDDYRSAVLISGSERAKLRLGRMLLDFSHPASRFGGQFSLERHRFEVSAGLNSCDAHFFLL